MILNLTGGFKNFSKNESVKLDSFLTRMTLKGELEGIIIDIMGDKGDKEGLIKIADNIIKALLPEDVKKGDRINITVFKEGGKFILKIGGKERPAISTTLDGAAKVAVNKEDVYHIRIPEKVNVRQIIAQIQRSVTELKSAQFQEIQDVAKKIEAALRSLVIEIDDNTSTKELAYEIRRYVKESGIFYETKLIALATEPVSAGSATGVETKAGADVVTGIKDDMKYKINIIMAELDTARQYAADEAKLSSSISKLITQISGFVLADDGAQSDQPANPPFAQLSAIFDRLTQMDMTAMLRSDYRAGKNLTEAVVKLIDFLSSAANVIKPPEAFVLTAELSSILKAAVAVQTKISKAVSKLFKGYAILSEDPMQGKESDGAAEAKTALYTRLTGKLAALEEKLSLMKETIGRAQDEPAAHKSAKPDALDAMPLKKQLRSLLQELARGSERLFAKSEAAKTLEALAKSFTRLTEGIEYQQLSNIHTAKGDINYFMLPVAFNNTLQTPEIVITTKSAKKRQNGDDNDGRIEIFVDMKNAGHIKCDFSVTGKKITGAFYSMKDETVSAIGDELPLLKENLGRQDFNLVNVSSNKMMKAMTCDITPEDALIIEDISIFDFKV